MVKIERVVVGQLAVNCYVVWNKETKEAFVIDPADNAEDVYKVIKDEKLTVKSIINTHAHFDHVGGIGAFKDLADTKFGLHKDDVELLLEKGVRVNTRDNNGYTPLQLAAKYSHLEIINLLINLLIKHGAKE